uniref:Uncharacterized protein n=2 Tax=Avena sativa TaxID=4498 RepID=A0ACD5WA34_AVESA
MPTSSSSPMDAVTAAKKMSRGGEGKKQQRQSGSSFWGAMALKNRSQPEGEGAGESKNMSSKRKTTTTRTSISIGRSITCAGSICGTKESAVLSRGSGRSSRGNSSSRSLKAPDNDTLSVSMAASSAVVSASSSFNSETTVATTATTVSSSSSSSSPLSSIGSGSRSFRKLSGCYYECHSVLEPGRTSHVGGAAMAMLPCADCDEFFVKAEALELHRSTRHAVSELGAEDTSRNVVEIIFQSSWLVRKPRAAPVCRIERVLKVQNFGKTVERFEQHRERVKASAAASSADELARRSYARCAADGNELLRFHCTTFNGCSLGLAGSTALCRSPSQCKLCSIVRDGFRVDGDGKIATMVTSGRAHDTALLSPSDGGVEKRAMLVCRVVAGRVKKVVSGSNPSDEFGCDSVSSSPDLDELSVFSSRAILPCFVVIYTVATEP